MYHPPSDFSLYGLDQCSAGAVGNLPICTLGLELAVQT